VFSDDHQTYLPSVGEVWFEDGEEVCACCTSFSTLAGVSRMEFFLWDLDLVARCFEVEKLSPLVLDENMMKVDGILWYPAR
jgi:hypothetical protein